MAEVTPVQRVILGGELRRLRERALLTGQHLKDQLGWSTSKTSRIENAHISISRTDLELLLELYGASSVERERIISLYNRGSVQAWWRAYSTPGDVFLQYLDFEAVADTIDAWEIRVVPGLLQTEDYARCLLSAWRAIDADLTARAIEERLLVRMRRQGRLTSERPMSLNVVIDESVLLRRIGDEVVMRNQLLKLVQASELPNVSIRVLPLDAMRQIMEGHFLLLTLSVATGIEERLLYLDLSGSMDQIATDEVRIHEFQRMLDEITANSLSFERSRDLIKRHARERWGAVEEI